MLKISLIAVVVVAVVAVMSGIVTVQFHQEKVADVTNFVMALVTNKDRLAEGQKVIDNLKQQGQKMLAKGSSAPDASSGPTPEIAGARDTAPQDKKPTLDVNAKIPLSF